MGGRLSRLGGSGRTLSKPTQSSDAPLISVKLSEKALKPTPRKAEELQDLSKKELSSAVEQAAPEKSEYALDGEEKDLSLDSMLQDLGKSLHQRTTYFHDDQALAAAQARYTEKRNRHCGKIEPKDIIAAYQNFYQGRDSQGTGVVQDIAIRYKVDPAVLHRLFDVTCLPAVRNESKEDARGQIRMHAEWR